MIKDFLLTFFLVTVLCCVLLGMTSSCPEPFSNYTPATNLGEHRTVTLLPTENESLLGGKAEIYIQGGTIHIDIFAHLYAIGGDVFGAKRDTEPMYVVSLDRGKLVMGHLKRSGDGVYKLSFTTDDTSILKKYTTLDVYYTFMGKKTLVVSGTL